MRKNVTFNWKRLDYATNLVHALAHPLRLRILQLINENEETNVSDIYKSLDLEQSQTSHHLAILRKSGVVNSTQDGSFRIYSVNFDILKRVELAVNNFIEGNRKLAHKEVR